MSLKVINAVISSQKNPPFLFATRNKNKLREYERLLQSPVEGRDLQVPEIQDPDPLKVLEEKAKAAFAAYGGPIFVEDSSFTLPSLDNMIGPYADNETNSAKKLAAICRMFGPKEKRTAVVRVGIALFDGRKVWTWIGEVTGLVSKKPLGKNGFGFDPIFIPKGGTKTFAQMYDAQKDSYSPRRIALEKLRNNPPNVEHPIFSLQEPATFQVNRIRKDELTNQQALQFAFSLDMLQQAGVKPNADFLVGKYAPFVVKEYAQGAVREYTTTPDSPSMGLVLLTEVDLKTIPDEEGTPKPLRLKVDKQNNPLLFQMGPQAFKIALASRATEFLAMHSEEIHQHVRDLVSGKIPHVARSNTRSPVLEEILGYRIQKGAGVAVATKELGYKRESVAGMVSRKQAAQGILALGTDGIVSSVYAYGGMPPVSGSVDSIVTAAVSYMRSWIPRNGVFAGNFQRQLDVFIAAKNKITSFALPEDITEQVIAQIGISVGCDKTEEIAKQVAIFQKAGGHAARIYTTNPDKRIVDTAAAIHKVVGNDFLICVGPVTDKKQADMLHEKGHVRMFLVGHGGGENCTSLTAGGAANSIELLYELYLDKLFNDSLIGLEGGTGTTIGALLPMLDVISLNRRGVGGVECTGGLYCLKERKGQLVPVLPYHGSASAVTQLIESYVNPEIAKKRLGPDGIVQAVEGKPNYMLMKDPFRSNVNRIREARSFVGLALADQQSMSLYQLREKVAKQGHNHVAISPASSVIAGEHRTGI